MRLLVKRKADYIVRSWSSSQRILSSCKLPHGGVHGVEFACCLTDEVRSRGGRARKKLTPCGWLYRV